MTLNDQIQANKSEANEHMAEAVRLIEDEQYREAGDHLEIAQGSLLGVRLLLNGVIGPEPKIVIFAVDIL